MFIDTHTKDTMLNSICHLLNITHIELIKYLILFESETENYGEFLQKVDLFIEERVRIYPDEVLFFHLTRRLVGTENDIEGRNLANLLLTENSFSLLLKKFDMNFIRGNHHIDLIYKGKLIDWDNCENGNSSYMKSRLGYFEGREDFCFNGFAFEDLLYKNNYARQLYCMPEFLSQIVQCLNCTELGNYYYNNSKYYCFEYKLPLEEVIIDGKDEYNLHQKQCYIIRSVIERIYEYQIRNVKFIYDEENPILRLADDSVMEEKYFVNKKIITREMLL